MKKDGCGGCLLRILLIIVLITIVDLIAIVTIEKDMNKTFLPVTSKSTVPLPTKSDVAP